MIVAGVGERAGVIPLSTVKCYLGLLYLPCKLINCRINGGCTCYGELTAICVNERNCCYAGVIACVLLRISCACNIYVLKTIRDICSIKGYNVVATIVGERTGVVPLNAVKRDYSLCDAEFDFLLNTCKNYLVVKGICRSDSYDCTVIACLLRKLACCKLFVRTVRKSYLVNIVEGKLAFGNVKSRSMVLCVVNNAGVVDPANVGNGYNCLSYTPFLLAECLVSTGGVLCYCVVIVNACTGEGLVCRIIDSRSCNEVNCGCIGCACIGKNECKSYIFGKVGYLYALNSAVVNKGEVCRIVSVIIAVVCYPTERGEVDSLGSNCPSVLYCIRACPSIVGVATCDAYNCLSNVAACVGSLVAAKGNFKLCRIGCANRMLSAIVIFECAANPYDIAIGKGLGVNGPRHRSLIITLDRIVIVNSLKLCNGGVILCIGCFVAHDRYHGYESRILGLNSYGYSVGCTGVGERTCICPLDRISEGDTLLSDGNGFLAGFNNGFYTVINDSDHAVVLAAVLNVCYAKGICGCALNELAVLVPSICICCRGMERNCLCSKYDSLAVVNLIVLRNRKGCVSGLGNSIELNVCLRHLGVLCAILIYPSDDLVAVVFSLACEELNVCACRKESVCYNLTAVVIGYSVNVIELDLNVYSNSDNGVICKTVDNISELIAYLTCEICNVNCSVNCCAELTVAIVEVKESLFGYAFGNVAVNLLDNLHSLIVVRLILLNLVLDLLLGKTVKLLKSCKVLAVKDTLKVNVIEDLKKIVKSYVLDKRVDIIGVLGHCREHLVLKLIRNLRGVASLKCCLCKLIGNVDAHLNCTAAGIVDRNVVSRDLSYLSNLVISAAELKGYSELASANRREHSKEIAELHLIVGHICNLFKGRKILDKLLNGVNDKYLTLFIRVTEENVIVHVDIINEVKKVNEILCGCGITGVDLVVDLNVILMHHILYLCDPCIDICKGATNGSEHSLVKSCGVVGDLVLDSTLIKARRSKEAYVIISSKSVVVNSIVCLNVTHTLIVYKVILDVALAIAVDHINESRRRYCAGLVGLVSFVKIKLLIKVNGDNVILVIGEQLIHFTVKILGSGEI